MHVLYRVSPYLSTHPSPLGNNKLEITKTCFESFNRAVDTDIDLTIIADNLPPEYLHIFEGQRVIPGNGGNIKTFHQQLDIVCTLPNEDKVLLAEDDYLWMPNSLKTIERSLDEFEIMSPYDHPGHYLEERFKNQPKRIRLIDNQTYRDAPSNTLTFACRAYVIKQNIDLIKSFGVRDHEMFQALGKDLWVACPALATHTVVGLLSPNRDW